MTERNADSRPIGEGYREGRADAVAYALTALTLIGLGILLTTIVLNWIIGPTLAVVLAISYTSLCRRVAARRGSR